jgi:hypothetical protein
METIEQACKEGKIGIKDFFKFTAWKMPLRAHILDAGDYVILPHHTEKNILLIEKIAELDSPEKGDFVTSKGTTGPISGNIFIKLAKNKPDYMLIEGDNINHVYSLVNKYLHN